MSCHESVQGGTTGCKVAWNQDLWIEILLRLPAKSLIRCKSVCKLWLSIISALHFSRLHALRHPKPQPSLLLRTRASHLFYFHPILHSSARLIRYHIPLPNPKILSSCNGLLLLRCGDRLQKGYYIYNPTTRKSREIFLTDNNSFPAVLGINLAFDPSKSPHYKVVCIRAATKSSSSDSRICQVEVYDSETRTWKLCIESFTTSMLYDFSYGVYSNNMIHWGNFLPLYFDINKHEIGNLPDVHEIPWSEHRGRGEIFSEWQLLESNGHLQRLAIISDKLGKSIAVLELDQEDYSSGVVKFCHRLGPFPSMARVLSYIRGDEEETCSVVYHISGELRVYKFVEKRLSMVVDLKDEAFYVQNRMQFSPTNVHVFGETFAPV